LLDETSEPKWRSEAIPLDDYITTSERTYPDIETQYEQIDTAVDIAEDLDLPLIAVTDNYKTLADKPEGKRPDIMQFEAAPTPTRWERFKKFFTADRPALSPDADRMEKIDRAFDIAIGSPLRVFLKLGKGMMLNVPDLMWAGIKKITPEDVFSDELMNMNLDEAMDYAAGYNPSGFQKMTGELAEFVGRIQTVAPIAQKLGVIGNTPKDISVLQKASEAAKIFGAATVTEQTAKWASTKIDPSEAEYGYEGPTAVLRDMALGAAFSIAHSGVKAVWAKLTPTEQVRALKVLGLKKGATPDQINVASRNLAREYHPDKVKGFEQEFKNIIKARDLLRKGEPQDIVFRGQKVQFTPKLLVGEKIVAGKVVKPEVPTKVVKAPARVPAKAPVVPVEPRKPVEPTITAPEAEAKSVKGPSGITEGEIVEGIRLWSRAGKKPRFPRSFEWRKAKQIQEKLGNEGQLDIYDQADTGTLYGNITFPDGRVYPVRIADHPTKTTLHIVGKAKREAKIPKGLAKPTKAEQVVEKIGESKEVVVPDTDIESVAGPDIDSVSLERKGFATVPELRAITDASKKVFDTVLTFGEVRRQNPQLYDRLMKTFGKRSAAMETAVNKLERIMPKTVPLADDVLLANTYEVKGQEPPERLKELYDNLSKILAENEKQILKEGILSRTFQERMIDENLARMAALEETLKHPAKSKRMQRLIAENEALKNMRYLPHTQVARNVIADKINKLPDDKRKAFLDRLSSVYRKRAGKMTLKDYLKAGIIEPKDVRLSRLTAQALADYQRRSAMKALHDLAKEQGLIQPTSDALRAEGWLNQREIGITAPELKEKLVHPLYAQALREMVAARSGRGGLRRELFAMVKIGQFIKPTIIYTYNAVQKMFRGMYSLNPKTEAVALRQAFHHVLNKTELYDKLNQDNLFQFPYEVSRGTQEEQLQLWMNRHDPDIDRAIKYAEKITDTAFINTDISKRRFIRNIFMSAHRAIGRLTWTGDKVQRTQSYLVNRQMGYGHDDAIKLASRSHGAYSELSKKYKDFMSKYFFVYSFRWLMPIEMGKVLLEPVIEGAYKFLKTGERPPRHKMERWAKAVIASIAIPVFVDSYMRWRGFEPEKKLGPLAWKYKKTVVVDGREHEIVVGLNYILNQPIKYWQRLTSYNPIKPETRWMQSMKNVAKWELHPIYRIFFWDISQNRRSFGTGQKVYDTEANTAIQLAQVIGYTFGQSFRFIGGFMDAMGEGEMTELERERQEVILKEGLNGFDRILFTTLGYNYTRLPLEERQRIAMAQLNKEIMIRGITFHRKYEDEKLQDKMKQLEEWAMKMQTWIEDDMQ
jgi:hypothetical protein